MIDSFDIIKEYPLLEIDFEQIKLDTRKYFEGLGWI